MYYDLCLEFRPVSLKSGTVVCYDIIKLTYLPVAPYGFAGALFC